MREETERDEQRAIADIGARKVAEYKRLNPSGIAPGLPGSAGQPEDLDAVDAPPRKGRSKK